MPATLPSVARPRAGVVSRDSACGIHKRPQHSSRPAPHFQKYRPQSISNRHPAIRRCQLSAQALPLATLDSAGAAGTLLAEPVAMSSGPNIIKSPNDPKLYRWVTLENGLTALLIQDPDITLGQQHADDKADAMSIAAPSDAGQSMAEDEDEDSEGADGDADMEEGGDEDEDEGDEDEDEEDGPPGKRGSKQAPMKKASAALAVGVGSFSDPDDLPGLSHYLEHMLFMGSQQFPNENEYDAFLTAHGGSSNAYTELEYTNYHFDVHPDHLDGALQRFAAFFHAPLCLESSLEREVCAVDNEFTGVLQSDACRLLQLACHTAEEGHIYRKFTWGNKKSLWDMPLAAGTPVRERLLEYYKQHYSAERMSLVVLGGEDLDTQELRVRNLFGAVPAGKGPRPTFKNTGPPYKGRSMWVVPAVKQLQEVGVSFLLPSLQHLYRQKPEHYLSHLIGHEGPGSLLSALKDKGWATELSAGVDDYGYDSNSCCTVFSVTITLTDAGMEAGPGNGLAPLALLWQYLDMLRKAGPQEWVWHELHAMSELKWRFQEEEDALDYSSRLAAALHLHAPEHALIAEYLHESWDPQSVTRLLDLMHPTRGTYRIDLVTSSYNDLLPKLKLLNGTTTTVEPWFEFEAASVQLPEALLEEWAGTPPAACLHLPPENGYLPTDFSIRGPEAGATEEAGREKLAAARKLPMVLAVPPTLVLEEPGLRVWHKLDTTFKLPKVNAHFRVVMPTAGQDPRALAVGGLWKLLVEDALNEEMYLADVAGLHYHISRDRHDVVVRVDGFSHKLPLLTTKVFKTLSGLKVDRDRFELVKEALVRKYRNANLSAEKHCDWLRLHLLGHGSFHCDAVLEALLRLEPADVQDAIPQLLASCHVECLLHGNLTQQEAGQVAAAVHTTLGAGCRLEASLRPRDQCTQLPAGTTCRYKAPAKNPEDRNAAVQVYLQCAPPPGTSPRSRALLDLLEHLAYEPSFNTLRTKEQLGYSVSAMARLTHEVLGFCLAITSGQYHPQHLEERVDAFLLSFETLLQEMPEEEFLKNREALVASKLQKDRSLTDETDRWWDRVWRGSLEFLSREQDAAVLEALGRKDVLEFYRQYFSPRSPTRRKLVVQVTPAVGPASQYPPASTSGKDPSAGDGTTSSTSSAAAESVAGSASGVAGGQALAGVAAGGEQKVWEVQDIAEFHKKLGGYETGWHDPSEWAS